MRAAYVFLASGGEFTPDGKLNVLGGDFDTIFGPAFPLVQPHMVLLIKLLLDQGDTGHGHELRVSLLNAEGERVLSDLRGPIEVLGKAMRPDRPVGMGLALTAINLIFPRPGAYTWHVFVDDIEVAALKLYVEEQKLS